MGPDERCMVRCFTMYILCTLVLVLVHAQTEYMYIHYNILCIINVPKGLKARLFCIPNSNNNLSCMFPQRKRDVWNLGAGADIQTFKKYECEGARLHVISRALAKTCSSNFKVCVHTRILPAPWGATHSLEVCTNCETTAPIFWQWTAPGSRPGFSMSKFTAPSFQRNPRKPLSNQHLLNNFFVSLHLILLMSKIGRH